MVVLGRRSALCLSAYRNCINHVPLYSNHYADGITPELRKNNDGWELCWATRIRETCERMNLNQETTWKRGFIFSSLVGTVRNVQLTFTKTREKRVIKNFLPIKFYSFVIPWNLFHLNSLKQEENYGIY